MNFNSLTFFAFLGVVLLLYHALPWRIGRWVLVAASYIFYGAANPWYCTLLLTSTLVDFIVALCIPKARTEGARKRLLFVSLAVNLSLLGLFKYSAFFVTNFNSILGLGGIAALPVPGWILPVGISFYTVQTLSYTIDVYRGKTSPTKDFGAFALYVAFFPQLVAGPIERAHSLLPQLTQKQKVTVSDFEYGVQRILWGLVKKLVFADRLGLLVDTVFANPGGTSSPGLVLAALSFTFQLYLDFSAYTDIAIGTARLMGVRLRENFNWPYLSRNISEIWGRWHMSLTAWFRDYVYAAMGGTRRSRPAKTLFNLVLVMTLIGIWHGASWNFFAFGLFVGVTLAGYHYLRVFRTGKRGPFFGRRWWSAPLATLLTFAYINFILVIFRSSDLKTAWVFSRGILCHPWSWQPYYSIYALMVAFLMGIHIYRGVFMSGRQGVRMSPPVRGAFWFVMLMLIVYGAVERSEKFIYFQF